MWSPLRGILAAALALCGSGCTRGPDADPPVPCVTSADCTVGFVCREGACVEGMLPECVDRDRDGFGVDCLAGDDCDDADPTQTGREVCDEADNDCDDTADEGVRSPCGDCDGWCSVDGIGAGAPAGAFDLEADPSSDVAVDADGALVLESHRIDSPFIWIANTGEGTVSKIDTRTYVEVGRYATGPLGVANDPSRTSVNTFGDVYVGNRAGGSVAKISALGPECPDTNGDGVITTSTGPDDVLAWGMDDCVLFHTPLPGSLVRAVAAQDVVGLDWALVPYVWIGDWNARQVLKLDGTTGEILFRTASPTGTYGFALDGRGQLWISGRGDRAIGRIDTARCLDAASCDAPCTGSSDSCVKESIPLAGGDDPYGITVDSRQRVWTANLSDRTVTRYDPAAAVGARWAGGATPGECHGIAADAAGFVWAACYEAGVARLAMSSPTTSVVVGGTAGQSVKGIAVDYDGKIWAINQAHVGAVVITPGPTLADASVVSGVADRIVRPYTYSDMTGEQLRLVTRPRGFYRHIFEGCEDATAEIEWRELRFDAEVPPGTHLVFGARTAGTRDALAAAEWTEVAAVPPDASPASLADPLAAAGVAPAQLLEVEVELVSDGPFATGGRTPRVFSFGATRSCPTGVE